MNNKYHPDKGQMTQIKRDCRGKKVFLSRVGVVEG
jgi:hypothetical protein